MDRCILLESRGHLSLIMGFWYETIFHVGGALKKRLWLRYLQLPSMVLICLKLLEFSWGAFKTVASITKLFIVPQGVQVSTSQLFSLSYKFMMQIFMDY